MTRFRTTFRPVVVAATTVAAALWLPAGLAGQSCRGVPLADGALAVAGERGSAGQGGSRWAGDGSYRLAGPIALSAGYARTGYDDPAASTVTSLRFGVAYQRILARGSSGMRLTVCPTAEMRRERYGRLEVLWVPVGVAAGLGLSLARGWRGVLHVEPRAVYTRGEVVGLSDTTLSPGARGGATIEYGRLLLGVTHAWVRAARANRSTAIHAGVRIGGGGDR